MACGRWLDLAMILVFASFKGLDDCAIGCCGLFLDIMS